MFDHFNWKLPLLEFSSQDKDFKLSQKDGLNVLTAIVLEEPKEVLEEEVAVLEFHTEFNGQMDYLLKLTLSFFLRFLFNSFNSLSFKLLLD